MRRYFYFIFFVIIAFLIGIVFVFLINDSIVFIPKFFLHHEVKITDFSSSQKNVCTQGMFLWEDCRLKTFFSKHIENNYKKNDDQIIQYFITVFLREWAEFVLQVTDNHYIITVHNVCFNPAGVFFIDCAIEGNRKDQESSYGQWIVIENMFYSLKTIFPNIQELYLCKKDGLYPFDKIFPYASIVTFLPIKNNLQEEKKIIYIPLFYTFKGNVLFDQYERSLYSDLITENENKNNIIMFQKPFSDKGYYEQCSFLTKSDIACFISCHQAKKSYCMVIIPDRPFFDQGDFFTLYKCCKQNELSDSKKAVFFQKIKNHCDEKNIIFCVKKIHHLLFNRLTCDSIIIEYGGEGATDIKKFLSIMVSL